jgi:putative membrane protein
MRRLATAVTAVMIALGAAACGGSSPTAPSAAAPDAGQPAIAQSVSTSSAVTTGVTETSSGDPSVNSHDRDFIAFAAQYNQAMLDLGTVAEQRGDRPSVKFYAEQETQDHATEQAALRQTATDLFPSSTALNSDHAAERTQLLAVSGSAFDRIFIPMMVTEHQAALTRFQEAAAQSGASAPVRNYAQNEIAHIQSHLRMAQDLTGVVR